jgi:hypothetical protein
MSIPGLKERVIKILLLFFSEPDLFFGKKWEPTKMLDANDTLSFFEIGSNPGMIREPFKAAVDFWNALNI